MAVGRGNQPTDRGKIRVNLFIGKSTGKDDKGKYKELAIKYHYIKSLMKI
jgi:hypothetical protein